MKTTIDNRLRDKDDANFNDSESDNNNDVDADDENTCHPARFAGKSRGERRTAKACAK